MTNVSLPLYSSKNLQHWLRELKVFQSELVASFGNLCKSFKEKEKI